MKTTSKFPEPYRRTQLAALLLTCALWSADAHAAYLGEKALKWGVANIILPVGVLAIVIALASSFFNTKMASTAAVVAILCLVISFLSGQGTQLIQVLQP